MTEAEQGRAREQAAHNRQLASRAKPGEKIGAKVPAKLQGPYKGEAREQAATLPLGKYFHNGTWATLSAKLHEASKAERRTLTANLPEPLSQPQLAALRETHAGKQKPIPAKLQESEKGEALDEADPIRETFPETIARIGSDDHHRQPVEFR